MHEAQGQRVRMMVMVLAVVTGLTACATTDSGPVDSTRRPEAGSIRGIDPAPAQAPRLQQVRRPNIVLVLMDDFSMDLLATMRSARRMRREGASYPHSYVVDSLCCVSRASLLTGQYPHQTGVRTNVSGELPTTPLGGFAAFDGYGNPERSVNVALQDAGYVTGFVGKYLNEYEYAPRQPAPPAMPGWSSFEAVFGSAYDQWDFWTGRDTGRQRLALRHHPAPGRESSARERDAAYAGEHIERRALDFIDRHRDGDAPWFLEVAPYGPHNRTGDGHYPQDPFFPAMYRDRPSRSQPTGDCGAIACEDLDAAGLPGFGDDRDDNTPLTEAGVPARAWNTGTPPWGEQAYTTMRRDRARMAQQIDRMVERILDTLADDVARDTYVVLTSDNGFHLGQHGLGVGKGTAYRTDVQVPLLVVGPTVEPGERRELVSNIDLAPTIEDLAGLRPPAWRAGRSFADTFIDTDLAEQDVIFHEHTGQASTRLDPDAALAGGELDRIPSYVAVRSRDALLVRHDLDPDPAVLETAYEFYSYRDSAWERRNSFADPAHRGQVRTLMGHLERWDACADVSGDEPLSRGCRDLTVR